MDAPFAGFETKVTEMRAAGFHAAVFEEERSIWVFFCRPEGNHCEYTM
jgi:hypothetical protein